MPEFALAIARLLRRHRGDMDLCADGQGGEVIAELVGPNAEVGAIHPKAMPAIQIEPDE